MACSEDPIEFEGVEEVGNLGEVSADLLVSENVGEIFDEACRYSIGEVWKVMTPVHQPELVVGRLKEGLRQVLVGAFELKPEMKHPQEQPSFAIQVVGLDKLTGNTNLKEYYVRVDDDGKVAYIEGYESEYFVDLFGLREYKTSRVHAAAKKKRRRRRGVADGAQIFVSSWSHKKTLWQQPQQIAQWLYPRRRWGAEGISNFLKERERGDMAEQTGFAVVGLGMGRHHCKAIAAAPGARLVAVCDTDGERLSLVAEEYNCRAYDDYTELLADEEVTVVNIATPSGMHAAMGVQAAAAGKHMIVEKPADIKPERIDELIAAGKEHSVQVAGIFQSRLDPLNIRIREAIQSGRLGKLIGVHGHLPWYRKQSYYDGPHGKWKATWDMDGGGSLMNQGVHTVDLLQWLAGPVEAVAGMYGVFGHEIEAEDQSVALLRFKSGALGTLYTTTCCYPGYDQRVMIYGSEGSVSKNHSELEGWKLLADTEGTEEKELLGLYGASKDVSGSADPFAVGFDGHTQIIVDMYEALAEGREPLITLDSARHAVEIINGIFESARTGKEVKIG
ncbi:MAG: Gfo/Idh/MocA family protein [Candidatus Latescibacterota bacterium]|jgi:predicted dehydrogenase